MSDITNKEWETGDIIGATDLNAITPFMFTLVYNEQEDWDETSVTVQEILDAIQSHYFGYAVNLSAPPSVGYGCAIILSISFDERLMTYHMKLYGSNLGVIETIEMTASSTEEKFHTASYTQNSAS